MSALRLIRPLSRLLYAPLQNRRGVVFLLALYLTSITVLLLSGISLQRTLMEVQASQLSRSQHQALYLAEAGVDRALSDLRINENAVIDNTPYLQQLPTGSATYQVVTATSLEGNVVTTTRTISATGQTNGTPATAPAATTVTATVREAQRVEGMFSGQWLTTTSYWTIDDAGRLHVHAPHITGNIRHAAGTHNQRACGGDCGATLDQGTVVDGDVILAPPAAQDGYTSLISYTGDRSAGVVTWTSPDEPRTRISGNVYAESMRLLPAPSLPPSCPATTSAVWEVGPGEDYELRDGDPLDLSPPGDGRVIVCASRVKIHDGAKVTVHDPTTIYLTGQFVPGVSGLFINDGKIQTVTGLSDRPDRGLTLAVNVTPATAPGHWSAGVVFAGNFEGSVYAPRAAVHLDTAWHCIGDSTSAACRDARDLRLGFIVGQQVWVEELDELHLKSNTDTSPSLLQTPSLVGWQQP